MGIGDPRVMRGRSAMAFAMDVRCYRNAAWIGFGKRGAKESADPGTRRYGEGMVRM